METNQELHFLFGLPTGLAVMLIIGIPLAIAMAVLIRRALLHEKEIQEDGLVADAIVVRCESTLSDGRRRYSPYVRYVAGGEEHEAALNLRSNLPIGRKLKIKYVPGKWDYVVFVSQELS